MLLFLCLLPLALCPVLSAGPVLSVGPVLSAGPVLTAGPGPKSCQEMGFGPDHRLDRKTGQCHEAWKAGPCGHLPDVMEYLPTDEVYGECTCSVYNMKPWPADNLCYYLNSQGPCELGYRFTFESSQPPECKKDADCYEKIVETGKSWAWKDGGCHEELRRGPPCPDHHILVLQGHEEARCFDLLNLPMHAAQPDGGVRECTKAQKTVPSFLGGCLPSVPVLDGKDCPEGYVHHPAYDDVCVEG